MWTSPCLEPGCGSCWAQLGCRKYMIYMEISCRLSKVDLKHFRHFERSWNRPGQISRCTRPHNSPLHFDQLFLRSDRLKLLALRAVGGASGGASSNEQIPTTLKCGFHIKRSQLFGCKLLHCTFWPTSEKKNKSVYLTLWIFMTSWTLWSSWLYGEKWPGYRPTAVRWRCLHHLQDAASSEQSLSARLPDHHLWCNIWRPFAREKVRIC